MTATEPGSRRAAVRWPLRRSRRAYPYDEISVTDAIAALPPEAAPEPTFTARRPDPRRVTAPAPVLTAGAHARPAPAAAGADLTLLARVRDGLLRKSRAEAFTADKRDLPCFDAATRAAGWQGLHTPPGLLVSLHQRWTTGPWLAGELAANARAEAAARAALSADLRAARARVFAPLDGGAR